MRGSALEPGEGLVLLQALSDMLGALSTDVVAEHAARGSQNTRSADVKGY